MKHEELRGHRSLCVCVCVFCVYLLCVSMGVCLSSLLQGDWEKVSLCYPAPSSPSPTSLSVHSSQQTRSWIPRTGAQHSLTAQLTLHISPSLHNSMHKPFYWHIGISSTPSLPFTGSLPCLSCSTFSIVLMQTIITGKAGVCTLESSRFSEHPSNYQSVKGDDLTIAKGEKNWQICWEQTRKIVTSLIRAHLSK